MNLEQLETQCRNYLANAANPLVPVDILLKHLRKQDTLDLLTPEHLLSFLRGHHEFELLGGPDDADPIRQDDFAAVGILMGPRAILKTRIPDSNGLAALLVLQLEALEEMLGKALMGALGDSEDARAAALREALGRARDLKQKMKSLKAPAADE
jgi:hypothetical protein